jgi:hypothetical protein
MFRSIGLSLNEQHELLPSGRGLLVPLHHRKEFIDRPVRPMLHLMEYETFEDVATLLSRFINEV